MTTTTYAAAFSAARRAMVTKPYHRRADLLEKAAKLNRLMGDRTSLVAAERFDALAKIANFADFQDACRA